MQPCNSHNRIAILRPNEAYVFKGRIKTTQLEKRGQLFHLNRGLRVLFLLFFFFGMFVFKQNCRRNSDFIFVYFHALKTKESVWIPEQWISELHCSCVSILIFRTETKNFRLLALKLCLTDG